MKQYTVYVCETCEYESKNVEDMRAHEASHLGLTVKEMETYKAMKSFAAYMSSVIANIKNEEMEREYNKAIQDVIDFEKEHDIKV